MIRIGVVNIDVSHPLAFSKILLEEDRARYVAVYNDGFRSDAEVDAFIRKRGLECRCETVEELAGKVDVGFIQGCNWDRHLDYVEPFLKRDKPVFIDKPMVGSMRDIRRLESLMKRGLKVLGSSSLRYAEEIRDFLNIPEPERGRVLNVMGTCGVDEFNYGIHVVESIGAMLQHPVSVRFTQRSTVRRRRGGWQKGPRAIRLYLKAGATATYLTVTGVWLPCNFLITTNAAGLQRQRRTPAGFTKPCSTGSATSWSTARARSARFRKFSIPSRSCWRDDCPGSAAATSCASMKFPRTIPVLTAMRLSGTMPPRSAPIYLDEPEAP